VLSLPALVCARLLRPLWDESEAPARDQRAWPDILAAVPAAALLLFDRGVINCGLFAQLTLARITVVTRAKSALAWQVVRTVQRTSHVGGRCGLERSRHGPSVIRGRVLSQSPIRPPPTGSSLRKREHQLPGQVRQH
jgi:hypothetical protein